MNRRARQSIGLGALALVMILAMAGPRIATHSPSRQFADFVYAPPMLPHVIDGDGRLRAPFIYPVRLEDRLERRYAVDRSHPMPLQFGAGGKLVSVEPSVSSPWFLLGTDALGRDVFSRLVVGARLSLGVACAAAAGALLLGLLAGSFAGFAGGRVDEGLMRAAEFVIALPAIYVVLALRASLPLILSPGQVFWTMVGVFAAVGWPYAARGVRAIVATERTREYAEAARSLGASSTRILLRHLLPATRGFLLVQITLLVPAFIVAESTLSFVGLGFGEATPSWGAMLQEAGGGHTLAEAPWLMAPAVAIVVVVLAVNLVAADSSSAVPHTRNLS